MGVPCRGPPGCPHSYVFPLSPGGNVLSSLLLTIQTVTHRPQARAVPESSGPFPHEALANTPKYLPHPLLGILEGGIVLEGWRSPRTPSMGSQTPSRPGRPPRTGEAPPHLSWWHRVPWFLGGLSTRSGGRVSFRGAARETGARSEALLRGVGYVTLWDATSGNWCQAKDFS